MIWRRASTAAIAWVVLGGALLAAVEGIQVTPVVADGQVSASFTAPAAFDSDVQDVIRSGLLLTFTFTLELRRPATVWLDPLLGTSTVAASVKYDNLTGVYQVSKLKDGRVFWSDRTQEAAQVRTWVTNFERVALTTQEPLEPNVDYYIRVRMQTSPRRTFPLWPWSGDSASGRADFTFIR